METHTPQTRAEYELYLNNKMCIMCGKEAQLQLSYDVDLPTIKVCSSQCSYARQAYLNFKTNR